MADQMDDRTPDFIRYEFERRNLDLDDAQYADEADMLAREFNRMYPNDRSRILQMYTQLVEDCTTLVHIERNHPDTWEIATGSLSSPTELRLVRSFTMAGVTTVVRLTRSLDTVIHLKQRSAIEGTFQWVYDLKLWVDERRQPHSDADTSALEALQNTLADLFLDLPLNSALFSGRWQCVDEFGGGISRAGLWAKINEHGLVEDRIVQKKDYMEHWRWTDPLMWDSADPETRQPLELVLQNRCADVSGKHFARMRGFSQDHQAQILSMYVEYCPLGDFGKVHKFHQAEETERGVWRDAKPIPEPYLWMLFQYLIECCLIMRQGGINTTQPDWKQVVHLDIKPLNIFLDIAQTDYCPRYPTPKMGDFGLAIQTRPDDYNNPAAYNQNSGTKPFKAPEQTSLIDHQDMEFENVEEWLVLDHTNVYAIGAVIFALVNDESGWLNQPDFLDPCTEWYHTHYAQNNYSEQLLDLVTKCIEWRPSDRINAQALHRAVIDAVTELENSDMYEYILNARLGLQQRNAKYDLKGTKQDEYRIGFAPGDVEEGEFSDPSETMNLDGLGIRSKE